MVNSCNTCLMEVGDHVRVCLHFSTILYVILQLALLLYHIQIVFKCVDFNIGMMYNENKSKLYIAIS